MKLNKSVCNFKFSFIIIKCSIQFLFIFYCIYSATENERTLLDGATTSTDTQSIVSKKIEQQEEKEKEKKQDADNDDDSSNDNKQGSTCEEFEVIDEPTEPQSSSREPSPQTDITH